MTRGVGLSAGARCVANDPERRRYDDKYSGKAPQPSLRVQASCEGHAHALHTCFPFVPPLRQGGQAAGSPLVAWALARRRA